MRVNPIKDNEKIRKIIKELKSNKQDRNLIMILIGIYTGLRISDILALRVKDVKGKISIKKKEEKTKKYKSIAIHKELYKELETYCIGKSNDEYLIRSREGVNKPISRVQAYRIIKALQYKYRIADNLGCHSLRKTYGYNMYKKNDISIVQKSLNHSSQGDTIKYIGVEEEQINRATLNLKY
ncbi:MAG: tyrosine-type recombinase/integrase [Terrisporobacter sp.]